MTLTTREEVSRRYRAGESIHGIAGALRLRAETVWLWVQVDVGTRPAGRPRVATVSDAELLALRDRDGLSWSALGARLGLSSTQARRRYLAAAARPLAARAAYAAFHAAVDAAADRGVLTPCRLNAEFDDDGLTAATARTLARRCRSECPALRECRALAGLVAPTLQGPVVIAGQYHRPVPVREDIAGEVA